jgi:hypothetical protein
MGEMSHEFAVTGNGFRLRVEGQLQGETPSLLKDTVITASKGVSKSPPQLKMLYQIPVLIGEVYSPLECVSPLEIQLSNIQSVESLGDVKEYEFLLQMYYLRCAKIEEEEVEHPSNNESETRQIRIIKDIMRVQAVLLQDHPLLKLFLTILEKEDSCSRVLSFGLLENELAKRGEKE